MARRRARDVVRAALAIGLAFASVTGCYRYVGSERAPSLGGTELRAHLTDSGSSTLAPLLGSDVASVDGRIADATEASLVLLVARTTKRDGASSNWTGERVTIDRGSIARYELRVLDRKRTLLVGGLGAVAAVLTAKLFSLLGSGGSEPPSTMPGPPT